MLAVHVHDDEDEHDRLLVVFTVLEIDPIGKDVRVPLLQRGCSLCGVLLLPDLLHPADTGCGKRHRIPDKRPENEMVLTQATTTQKVWIPQGTTPGVLELNSTRKSRSIYGFLNLKTGQEHAFSTEHQTMYETANVLVKIRRCNPTQKILIIWYGAGWHRGSVAQDALPTHHMDSIHVPAYSPELNPQEHVWKQGRSAVSHNRFIPNIEPVTKDFVEYLNKTTFNYSLLDFRST